MGLRRFGGGLAEAFHILLRRTISRLEPARQRKTEAVRRSRQGDLTSRRSSQSAPGPRQSRRRQAPPACAAGPAPRLRSAAFLSLSGTTTLRASSCKEDVGALAVDRIAEDRPALRRAMDAQLMRSPRLRLELEPGDRPAAPDAPSLDPPERPRRLALRIDLHPPAARVVEPAEREDPLRRSPPPANRRRSPSRSLQFCPA